MRLSFFRANVSSSSSTPFFFLGTAISARAVRWTTTSSSSSTAAPSLPTDFRFRDLRWLSTNWVGSSSSFTSSSLAFSSKIFPWAADFPLAGVRAEARVGVEVFVALWSKRFGTTSFSRMKNCETGSST